MPAGIVQKFEGAMRHMMAVANNAQWDDPAVPFAFILLDVSWTPSDADNSYGSLSVHECASPDYAPKAVTGRTIAGTGHNCFADSADAIFGSLVTISARYLVCVQGDPAALVAGDAAIFWVDLDTTAGALNKSSAADNFALQAPASGWFNSGIQA